jgi:hypothetical protein
MPNPAGSLGSVFALHILDTNEAKEKHSDSLRRDTSGLDAAGTRTSAETSGETSIADMRDFVLKEDARSKPVGARRNGALQ